MSDRLSFSLLSLLLNFLTLVIRPFRTFRSIVTFLMLIGFPGVGTFIRKLLTPHSLPKVRNDGRLFLLPLTHWGLLFYQYIGECIQRSRIIIDVREWFQCLSYLKRKQCVLWKVVFGLGYFLHQFILHKL